MSTENAEKSAFPIAENMDTQSMELGLTKREYFAAICLQGMLANPELYNIAASKLHVDKIAPFYCESAIEQADELLKQLSQ